MKKLLLLGTVIALQACTSGEEHSQPAEETAAPREVDLNAIADSSATHKNEDGSYAELKYHQGQLTGTAKMYNPDGQLSATVNYKDGKKHGRYTRYNQEGKPALETEYHHGLPLPSAESSLDSNLSAEKALITVSEENKLAEEGYISYTFSLPDSCRHPQFYLLEEKQSWQGNNALLKQRKMEMAGNKGVLTIRTEPGYGITKMVYIYATYEVEGEIEMAAMKPHKIEAIN